MERSELQRGIEAILFAAGERVEVSRLCMALETDEDEIIAAADALADTYSSPRPWRLGNRPSFPRLSWRR